MAKWHLTANGEPGKCKASVRACPIGGKHFHTEKEARDFYESDKPAFAESLSKDDLATSALMVQSQDSETFKLTFDDDFIQQRDDEYYATIAELSNEDLTDFEEPDYFASNIEGRSVAEIKAIAQAKKESDARNKLQAAWSAHRNKNLTTLTNRFMTAQFGDSYKELKARKAQLMHNAHYKKQELVSKIPSLKRLLASRSNKALNKIELTPTRMSTLKGKLADSLVMLKHDQVQKLEERVLKNNAFNERYRTSVRRKLFIAAAMKAIKLAVKVLPQAETVQAITTTVKGSGIYTVAKSTADNNVKILGPAGKPLIKLAQKQATAKVNEICKTKLGESFDYASDHHRGKKNEEVLVRTLPKLEDL